VPGQEKLPAGRKVFGPISGIALWHGHTGRGVDHPAAISLNGEGVTGWKPVPLGSACECAERKIKYECR
jgi:hypothetical protein